MTEPHLHPPTDELLRFLLKEMPSKQRERLAAHLDCCPTCRERVDGWRSARRRLDLWRLPGARPEMMRRSVLASVPLGWVAAVALALLAGYLAGRPVHTPSPSAISPGHLAPTALAPETTATLAEEVQRLRRDQESRFRQLRRDLETLAITTDAALRQNKLDLLQVTHSTRPPHPPTP
ncbi:MAG: hypothetical protein IT580_16985 [Verrucomicrobiales bacterium]|nr:hypothetical protein [Verrucomicrobiales bacterium]